MQLTEELHALVTKLEAEEHHLAAEARAVYEKLHAQLVKADPKAAPDAPAEPPTAS